MKKALSRLFAVVATLCLFTACGNKAEDPFVAIGGEDLSQTVICPRQVLLQELDRDVDGLISCDTEYYVQLPEPLGYRVPNIGGSTSISTLSIKQATIAMPLRDAPAFAILCAVLPGRWLWIR